MNEHVKKAADELEAAIEDFRIEEMRQNIFNLLMASKAALILLRVASTDPK